MGGSLVKPSKSIVPSVSTRPEWRGQPDTTSRVGRALALSLLLHAPLTPLAALVGLVGLLGSAPDEAELPAVAPITAIPLDLIEVEVGDEAVGRTGESPESGEPPEPAGAPPTAEPEPSAPLVAELPTPPKPAPSREAGDKPAGAEGPTDVPASGPSVGDPVTLSGKAGQVTDANANVRLLVFADRIRSHQLGRKVGALLGAAAQWRDFFGPGGLDPVRDIDRILIAGPQLRDSSQVVAVLKVSADPARVRGAVDALVARDGQGGWLDAGVPAARANADRAERVFVLSGKDIVIVAPPSAADNAIKQAKGLRFPNPKGSEAVTAYVVTPWRAFIGIPFEVPKSIRWVRMKITATADGGAVAELIAEDESDELARKNARSLTEKLNAVSHIDLKKKGGVLGKAARFLFGDEVRLVEPVAFTSSGKQIHGRVVATPKQLGSLLDAISSYAEHHAQEAARKQRERQADAGVDVAPAAPLPAPDATAPEPSPAPAEQAPTDAGGANESP